MPEYKYSGPVDSSVTIDIANLKDKTAIVTGGASGIGEGYVWALVAAGAYVCIGDLNEERGLKLEKELPRYCFLINCTHLRYSDRLTESNSSKSTYQSGRIKRDYSRKQRSSRHQGRSHMSLQTRA
jgi:hypothetical protein